METAKKPTLFMAMLPVIILVIMLALGVYLFGDELLFSF